MLFQRQKEREVGAKTRSSNCKGMPNEKQAAKGNNVIVPSTSKPTEAQGEHDSNTKGVASAKDAGDIECVCDANQDTIGKEGFIPPSINEGTQHVEGHVENV